jgi:hypothetical protein
MVLALRFVGRYTVSKKSVPLNRARKVDLPRFPRLGIHDNEIKLQLLYHFDVLHRARAWPLPTAVMRELLRKFRLYGFGKIDGPKRV